MEDGILGLGIRIGQFEDGGAGGDRHKYEEGYIRLKGPWGGAIKLKG